MKKALLTLTSLLMSLGLAAQVITFYTPQTVRVQKAAAGQAPVRKYNFVVTTQPEAVKVKTTTKGDFVTYASSALVVTVNTRTQQVSFADAKGRALVAEGAMSLTPIAEGPDQGSYRVRQSWALADDEPLYGVGLLQNGKMSQRGEKRLMTQSNLEDFANVFQSVKGYGIFWDNYSPTELDSRSGLTLESQVGEGVDYYFMYGGSADGVIRELRHLTGRSPMLPLWTYGFHQSRERYKSQEELLEVVDTYRRLGVPLDGIIQDWQYWGSNYNWNAMEFLNENFQGAQRMIDQVHQKYHAHMSISIWASFGPFTKGYKQMEELQVFSQMVSLSIEYRSPAKFEEKVVVETKLVSYDGNQMEIAYRIYDKTTGEDRAIAKSKHCFMNYSGIPISMKRIYPELETKFFEFK